MQVDVTLVIAVVGGILSVALGLYVGLLRYTVGRRDRELDEHLKRLDAEVTKAFDRINLEEKSTIRQDGEIKVVTQVQNDVKGDIEEVKRTMVTKAEWEPRMTNLERTANQILSELRGNRYPSAGGMRAVNPESPFPKR